ncbi:MAG: putative maltokinase [Isosphaeraceae bacterium]|nr:putative maltokinase [Isosphaeraceae bacterium]
MDAATRDRLEREALPAFLPRQRWFASKARTVAAVRVVDAAPLIGATPPTFAEASEVAPLLILIEVGFHGGAAETYFVPLVRATGPAGGRLAPGAILSRLDGPGEAEVIADALADDAACAALLAVIEAGHRLKTQSGEIRALPTTVYAEARGPTDRPLTIARGTAEQSNSAVLYGDQLILKVFRRLEPGINPDFEIGRFLSERTTFDRIPKTAGALEYDRPGAEPITLAILQGLVPNQGTGWEHALDELERYYARVSLRADDPSAPGAAEVIGAYRDDATRLGQRTAELHLALASDPNDPNFAPEPLTTADLAALARDIRDQVERALSALRDKLGDLPPQTIGQARRALDGVPRLMGPLDDLPALATGATKIRLHGDYHLGQVLWANGDYVILDFEGEPARPLVKRREKQSPLKDVVGMLRSFDYAAYAGLFAFTRDRPGAFERLTPWARAWRDGTSAAFLGAYFATTQGASFLPAEEAHRDLLLRSFTLEKALYELLYELNNRPDWVRIPLQGILALVEQGGLEPEKGPLIKR